MKNAFEITQFETCENPLMYLLPIPLDRFDRMSEGDATGTEVYLKCGRMIWTWDSPHYVQRFFDQAVVKAWRADSFLRLRQGRAPISKEEYAERHGHICAQRFDHG